MNDRLPIATAAACAIGALHPLDVPIWPCVALISVAALRRWWVVLLVAAFLLTASRSHQAWAALDSEPPEMIDGVVQVVTDPERHDATTVAVVSVDGHRLVASGWGAAGAALGRASAGHRVEVTGSTAPWRVADHRRAATGASFRLSLSDVGEVRSGAPWWRAANGLRTLLTGGAEHLGPERRSLFTGLVYGDDREQSDLVASDFRAVGLTHLLAVSGQNVAYVLTLLRPLLQRLRFDHRWFVVLATLFLFATMTRFEPSVLRATLMAALASTGELLGRGTEPRRTLAVAVAALVVFDPLLMSTVAFRLSVAATAGIVVGAGPLATRLGGGVAAEALAVTLAAQLAVAPVLITTFGPISVVSIPANLLAGPVAGLVMLWGMTGGFLAGFASASGMDWLASAIHRPTELALWWLEFVARSSAGIPLHRVGLTWIAAASTSVAAIAGSSRVWSVRRWVGLSLAVILVWGLRPQPVTGVFAVGPGGTLFAHDEAVVLSLAGRDDPGATLDDLRSHDLHTFDVVLVDTARPRADLDAVRSRFRVGAIWRVPASADRPAITVGQTAGGNEIEITVGPDGRSVQIVTRNQ